MGVMRRAICDCHLLHVDTMSEHVEVTRRALFDFDICGAQSLIEIFGCNIFFGRGLFGRCLFRNLFWTLVHTDVICLNVDGTTLMRDSDVVAFLQTRLFQTPYLSDTISFGCRCYFSHASALPRTRMLLFLRTRMLFFVCF